ncbi:MAG: DUF4468 domain-containing protein [Prevotellaceae bacterium]|nr:DUF4468 domain-containing protein [Candidatus Minthosoma caballi]
MKKIIIALMASALPFMMQAQSEGLFARKTMKAAKADMSAYAKPGAIPSVDGAVAFVSTIAVPGKTKEQIYQNVAQWASLRYEPNSVRGVYTDPDFFKNIEYSLVKSADKQNGIIKCVGAEELIFSIKTLAKNYTQVFYMLDLTIGDGKVDFNMHTLSFNVDQGEGNFVRMAAEDWITDKECINKKGELRKIPGKFRIKTIDLVDELKKEILEAASK